MRVREIMTRDPSCVTPETPVSAAARLMKDQDVGMIPVVESNGSRKLIGVVTDRDITIRHVAEGNSSAERPVREVMSGNVSTCTVDSDVDEVMNVMGREQVRRIPIVDERGDLVGIVSQADVVLDAASDTKAEETVEKISRPTGKHSG